MRVRMVTGTFSAAVPGSDLVIDGIMANVARSIRFLGKKRGDRRTGSPVVGGLGEAVFFGALFLLGAVALAYLIASRFVAVPAGPYQPGFGFWLMVLAAASLAFFGGGSVIYTVLNLETSA